MEKKEKKLTPQQEMFCHEFIKDLKVIPSMLRAGYAETTANKKCGNMLSNPLIAARIEELRADQMRRTQITQDEILKRLIRIADAAENTEDHQPAIRALELLGKHLAMWTDKTVSDVNINNPFASGESEEDIKRDTERLVKIAGPMLKVVNGGKEDG